MKIIREESVYLIPEENNIVVLAGDNQEEIIDCFINQFVKKKRNYCKVYDSQEQQIKATELNFIYYPYGSDICSNFQFSMKSFYNTEITSIIQENENDFQSFEMVRNGICGITTDHGMYKLKGVLTRGLNSNVDVEMVDFDISKLLSMLSINTDNISIDNQYAMLYNLLIFINRNQYNVVYIDFPITQSIIKWITSFKEDNILFLLSNDTIASDIAKELNRFSMLIFPIYKTLILCFISNNKQKKTFD